MRLLSAGKCEICSMLLLVADAIIAVELVTVVVADAVAWLLLWCLGYVVLATEPSRFVHCSISCSVDLGNFQSKSKLKPLLSCTVKKENTFTCAI